MKLAEYVIREDGNRLLISSHASEHLEAIKAIEFSNSLLMQASHKEIDQKSSQVLKLAEKLRDSQSKILKLEELADSTRMKTYADQRQHQVMVETLKTDVDNCRVVIEDKNSAIQMLNEDITRLQSALELAVDFSTEADVASKSLTCDHQKKVKALNTELESSANLINSLKAKYDALKADISPANAIADLKHKYANQTAGNTLIA